MIDPGPLEYFQHRGVDRQNLGYEFPESGAAGNGDEMAQQRRSDALPLVLVHNGERHLCRPGLDDDVPPATNDRWSRAFLHDRDQGYVVDEVDVEEGRDLLFGELVFHAEKAAVEGVRA